jgi:hypothetical protein
MGTPRSRTANLPNDRARPLLARVCAILFCAGCNGARPPAPAATPAPALVASNAQTPAAPPAPSPGPNAGRSDPTCFAPLTGNSVRVALRPAKGQLVLGVVAGLKDASDENLVHLRALVAELRRNGAELLIAAGDLGDNSNSQEELLSALTSGDPPLPLVVLAGNREVRTDLDAAEATIRKRGLQLVDLSHTRVVDLGDVLIVGVPGVYEPRLLRADGACLYTQSDLDALAAWLDKLPPAAPPALMVAAVPPHGEGPQALDFTEGQNVGEMRFIPMLTSTRARFGVFGQVWEAGGRAIDGQGRAVPTGQFSNQLYVNPGAADRTPWPMDDGSTSHGGAALITIRARQASFDSIHEPPAPARSP